MTNEKARRRNWAMLMGAHLAHADFVRGMLDVLEHKEARIRPSAAWALLPLGPKLGEAVEILQGLPVEGEDADMLARIEEMRVRLRMLEAVATAHANQEHETREPWEQERH